MQELSKIPGVRVTRILDARLLTGMAALYWFEQDPSHVYYLVSLRQFSFTFGALPVTFARKITNFLSENPGSVVSSIEPHLHLEETLVDVYNVQWNTAVFMMMFISSFVMMLLYSLVQFLGVGVSLPLHNFKRIYVLLKESFSYYLLVLSNSSE